MRGLSINDRSATVSRKPERKANNRRVTPAVFAFVAGLSACTRPEGTLHVSVELPGAPATSVEISAVPYDVARVMDSLERASPDPRPTFPGLEEGMAK